MKMVQQQSIKIWILLLAVVIPLSAIAQNQVLSQPLKVEIDKSILVTILADYIEDAQKNGGFYEDKGIISLTTCSSGSDEGIKYSLKVYIDNRYENLAISKYAYFGNHVVLFDSCRTEPNISNKDEYFKALNAEIGDRVYKVPVKKGRWMTYRTKEGKIESGMKVVKDIRLGAGETYERIYLVDDNNKFKKLSTL